MRAHATFGLINSTPHSARRASRSAVAPQPLEVGNRTRHHRHGDAHQHAGHRRHQPGAEQGRLGVERSELDIRRGQILGFVGASGSGKSVLLRTILGLTKKRSGTIRILASPGNTTGGRVVRLGYREVSIAEARMLAPGARVTLCAGEPAALGRAVEAALADHRTAGGSSHGRDWHAATSELLASLGLRGRGRSDQVLHAVFDRADHVGLVLG